MQNFCGKGTLILTSTSLLQQTVFSAITNNPVVPAGTWTHISGTYAYIGGKASIYVNGVLKKEELTGKGTLSQVRLFKGELNAKTKLFLFESIGIVD